MRKNNRKYHYFYKITNLINDHFYYGVHNTDNLDDGYMGSGTRLKKAYKKYGIENFKKEILKFFNTSKEAFEYEAEIVTEELKIDNNCYNIQGGGESFNTSGYVCVKDNIGNTFFVRTDDPRYINGELKHVGKGLFVAKDKNGNHYYISKEDPRFISGELVGCSKGIKYSEEHNKKLKEIIHIVHKPHKTCYVCNEFEIIKIKVTDKEAYLNQGYQEGKKYRKIIRQSTSDTHKKLNYQMGEKNSQYGTCWIHNDKENKKIKKEELENYINKGWIKGRKMKFN
jgi:hypothetical protein